MVHCCHVEVGFFSGSAEINCSFSNVAAHSYVTSYFKETFKPKTLLNYDHSDFGSIFCVHLFQSKSFCILPLHIQILSVRNLL